MPRTILYLLAPFIYLVFWAGYLLGQYAYYAESDPQSLGLAYQRLFVGQRDLLLLAELAFPAGMALFFATIFFFKLRKSNIRIPLLIAQFISLEFFVYRQFMFSDSYSSYQSASQLEIPIEYYESPSFYAFLIPMAIGFLLMLFVREKLGAEAENPLLRRRHA